MQYPVETISKFIFNLLLFRAAASITPVVTVSVSANDIVSRTIITYYVPVLLQ